MNSLLATIMLVTYLFSMPSVNDALNDPTYFPFIYVFKQAVPTSGVNALVILVFLLVIISNIDYVSLPFFATYHLHAILTVPLRTQPPPVKPGRSPETRASPFTPGLAESTQHCTSRRTPSVSRVSSPLCSAASTSAPMLPSTPSSHFRLSRSCSHTLSPSGVYSTGGYTTRSYCQRRGGVSVVGVFLSTQWQLYTPPTPSSGASGLGRRPSIPRL